MRKIASQSNTTIKFIKSLQLRKKRKQSGKFYIEGVRQVGEAVSNNFPLELIIYSTDLLFSAYGKEIISKAENMNIEIIEVTDDVFQSFSIKDGPHGLAAIGKQQFSNLEETNIDGVWIALEEVQDPGNLGSILRSLDGAGGKGIITIGNSTDPYHPTAVRSSMGAIFYTPCIATTLEEFIIKVKKDNVYCVGTSCDTANSYKTISYPKNMILIMGSEQKGLSKRLEHECNELINIPMEGRIDSLNLANAASIVLFEISSKKKLQ